ncbi:hypothetical protein E3P99_00638 [Wallemia hederae]|uniref:cystathionine beta-synthase n=1 Tax=Wallemia hederae TaxID=1540922 RepID=A0A4T0FX24_9BASI|nr:hypothetical protein E3P99_00638 [Wallemia hederae]
MKNTILVSTAAVLASTQAVAVGSPTHLITRELPNPSDIFSGGGNTTALVQCGQNQCKEANDKEMGCEDIIAGMSQSELNDDEEKLRKYANCYCDAYSIINTNQDCAQCLNDALDNATDQINQYCDLVKTNGTDSGNDDNGDNNNDGNDDSNDESNDDDDGPSGGFKALPALSVASLVAAAVVRLDKIAAESGLRCNLLAKVEAFSAGGSLKDRIALRMVLEAERKGELVRGRSTIIEPTSGNTGIGLCLVGARLGYRVIITLPEKMSLEKERLMRALGAEIIRTPTDARSESDESNIGVAKRLTREIDGGVMLDQYNNVNNALAHELSTSVEIAEDIQTSLGHDAIADVLIAGCGTGGTISGIARGLRKHNVQHHPTNGFREGLHVVGVDPVGSTLAQPESLNQLAEGDSGAYAIEGIGYDFIPTNLDRTVVDSWVKTNDEDAFECARQLIRQEGLLVGGSSGSCLAGALQFLASPQGNSIAQDPTKTVVLIFADSIRNYITKDWILS